MDLYPDSLSWLGWMDLYPDSLGWLGWICIRIHWAGKDGSVSGFIGLVRIDLYPDSLGWLGWICIRIR